MNERLIQFLCDCGAVSHFCARATIVVARAMAAVFIGLLCTPLSLAFIGVKALVRLCKQS